MSQQTQHTPSANDVLMGGGGAPTAKFANPGDTVGGRILAEPRVYQEREYDPRNPGNGPLKYYPKSGDPIMSVSVDVATNLRDPSDPEDDGTRRIYIEGKRLKDAVRDAVRAAGAPGLQIGGELYVTFTGLGQAENGMNAPKLYTARYVPASVGQANQALGTAQPEPQAATYSPAQAQETGNGWGQQPAPAAAPAQPAAGPTGADIETAKALIQANLTDEQILTTCPSFAGHQHVLAALRNAA